MEGSKFLISEKEGKDTLFIITRLYFFLFGIHVMELTCELRERRALDHLTEAIIAIKLYLPFPDCAIFAHLLNTGVSTQ